MKDKTKRLVLLASATAVALMLSFVETLIPAFIPIPGIKIGLANIAVIFALYRLGMKDAVYVQALRVSLASLLFGSVTSFIYGISGAALSLTAMALLKRTGVLSTVTVSVVGAVSHNLAQIAAASVILQTNVVIYYLPFLILSGTVSGIAVGIAGAVLVKKIPTSII